MDTDVLLALLSSLLGSQQYDQATLLDALVECDGDVDKAARRLLKRNTNDGPHSRKRKRKVGLDAWLDSSKSKVSRRTSGPSSGRSDAPAVSFNESASEKVSSSSTKSVSPLKNENQSARSMHETYPSNVQAQEAIDPVPSVFSSGTSSTKVRNISNNEFMKLLRPPNSKDSNVNKRLPRAPPLTLGTPLLVAQHTPCTLHPSILPPELACRLFYTMLHESRTWQRNRWWLFERVVESPHRTSFYCRKSFSGGSDDRQDMQQAAQFWYNGRQTEPPSTFPLAMEEACKIVERVVNEEMRKRQRFPLEWGGESCEDYKDLDGKVIWRANVAASNCYEGAKESVGYHTDQLTNIGPYPTIASLSLGTSRIFRLREVIPVEDKEQRSARTYNIPLQHNSVRASIASYYPELLRNLELVIMHASTQEMFKHCIPPQNAIDLFHPPFPPPVTTSADGSEEPLPAIESSNARINITFRFYRPDYRSESTPKCKCGVPCILRPDMKNRYVDPNTANAHERRDEGFKKNVVAKYWWTCYAGAQNDGKGCNMWKVMDAEAEGRGPFAGDNLLASGSH
ncbi:uncharacterized protein FIBRA_01355 [Fibroporia radiculosa]|uniref:Fe2OG dioxygenase domain-containing protein n=1 Tax=Fibroporia radiculosa TaxID=599839 RepID=J4HT70_9APHY|nr:uncharacterized protein FIBRA_01355 [Fibroporia radiculosa]CCL99337.1 predicted protein [Fibroporia radiculosa]